MKRVGGITSRLLWCAWLQSRTGSQACLKRRGRQSRVRTMRNDMSSMQGRHPRNERARHMLDVLVLQSGQKGDRSMNRWIVGLLVGLGVAVSGTVLLLRGEK